NLLSKTVTKCNAENLSVIVGYDNRLQGGYTYDAAGNLIADPTDGVTATYDPENRISSSTKDGITTNYVYDADGNRVEKTTGSTGTGGGSVMTPPGAPATLYWYMTPGIVAESDSDGNLQSEYVFFAGERVARRDFATEAVAYYFSDHLKTASVITDAQGNI